MNPTLAQYQSQAFPFNSPNQFTQPQQLYAQYQAQHAAYGPAQGRGNNNLGQMPQTSQAPTQFNQTGSPDRSSAPFQSPTPSAVNNTPQQPNAAAANSGSTPLNLMQQRQQMQNSAISQQQNTGQPLRAVPQPTVSLSPQSAQRERARVTVLLEINGHLLQEVVSLQAQGKAGSAPTQPQQSPTSPTSATDPSQTLNNSPVDPSKPTKAASQEYADCMRRLQANLSYLAALADAKKKVNGSLPVGPAIMIPPPHLSTVQELYKRLNNLFPEASQSTINKAMAVASAQAAKPPQPVQAQG